MVSGSGIGNRLLTLNVRGRTRRICWAVAFSVFVLACVGYALDVLRVGGFNIPPQTGGDSVIFDSLGWELAQGRGFAVNLQDSGFREPYLQADPTTAERLDTRTPSGAITGRPPLLPLVMAAWNQLFGRQFWGVRLVNVIAMSIVAAMVAATVCRMLGPIPAMLAAAQFVVLDPRTRIAAREILTESLAGLLVAVLTVLLQSYCRKPRLRWALLGGVLLGVAILLRTIFVLWGPWLAMLMWIGSRGHHWSADAASGAAPADVPQLPATFGRNAGRFIGVLGFVAAAALVVAPWGMRNVRLLKRPMPLGTQGLMELSAGYSDAAFERAGMWHNLDETGFFQTVATDGNDAAGWELARADYSRDRALAWCIKHPLKSIVLPLMKVVQEFRPHTSADLYILAFAVLGLLWLRGTVEGFVWTGILLTTAFAVAATWSVAGRFVVPSLFVLHCAAAVGVWNSLLVATAGRWVRPFANSAGGHAETPGGA